MHRHAARARIHARAVAPSRMGRHAASSIARDPSHLHADRQSRRDVRAHPRESERRRSDAQRAAKRRGTRAVSGGRPAHRAVAAVVSRAGGWPHGSGERGAAFGRRGATDVAAAQLRARLSFGIRLGRQHLVSVRAHRASNGASAGNVSAEDDVRGVVSASRLRIRAAEPSISAARRSVGLRVRPLARAQHLSADDARTRLMALDPQESDADVLASRHLQSDQGASHATRVAASSELLRFPYARRVFVAALAAERRIPRGRVAARARALATPGTS